MCFLSRVYCHLSWSTHCLHFRILILCFWPRQKMETKAAAVAVAAVAAVVAPAAQAAASTEIVGSLFTPPTIHQVREHPPNTHRNPLKPPRITPFLSHTFTSFLFTFFVVLFAGRLWLLRFLGLYFFAFCVIAFLWPSSVGKRRICIFIFWQFHLVPVFPSAVDCVYAPSSDWFKNCFLMT